MRLYQLKKAEFGEGCLRCMFNWQCRKNVRRCAKFWARQHHANELAARLDKRQPAHKRPPRRHDLQPS